MAFQEKQNQGVLFKNEQKSSDNSPAYKGRINVGGTTYWLAAWVKDAKDNRKYMSLSVTPMDAKPETKPAPKDAQKPQNNRGGGAFDQMADDVPFAPIGRGIAGHAE